MPNNLLRIAFTFATWITIAITATANPNSTIESVEKFINQNCVDCHSDDAAEANIRLDNWRKLDLEDQLDLLNKVQGQIFFRLMPPANHDQPPEAERVQTLECISRELRNHDACSLDEKLRRPEYGNYVNHADLFSPKFVELPGSTGDRRWLISEHIFNAKINRLLDYQGVRNIDGIRVDVVGDNGVGLGTRFGGGTLRQSIVNPFLLPKSIGIRYFDNTALTRGHLLTMIGNAKKIASHMTAEATVKARFPAMHHVLRTELQHRETLRRRIEFLDHHIIRVAREVHGDQSESMLPEFVAVVVEPPNRPVDSKGNPRQRETNLGLLDRYDAADMRAIYKGIGQYNQDGTSFDQVISHCQRDWFEYGIAESRIRERVGIMQSLYTLWDWDLVYNDIKKKRPKAIPYRPLADPEMKIIRATIRQQRVQGDTWQGLIDKCTDNWRQLFADERQSLGTVTDHELENVVHELYATILERQPSAQEMRDKTNLARSYLEKLSRQDALAKLTETLILSSEFVYRTEFGQGTADEHGRRMMSPREASYAIAYALTDSSPDQELVASAKNGRLNTREDYRREVSRMLQRRDIFYVIDESVQKAGFNASITNQPIRKLRFFREFFGYTKALTLFKDDARFGAGRYDNAKGRLVDEADMLVAFILEKDEDVFEELLSTEDFYVFHSGDNDAMTEASERLRTIYEYFNPLDWKNFTEDQLYEHWPFIKKMKMRGTVFPDFETNQKRKSGWVRSFKTIMSSLDERFGQGQQNAIPYDKLPMAYWHKGNATGRTGQVMRGHEVTTFFNIDYRDWDYPAIQPAPIKNRKGMLTHPAWLIAHAQNTETDPVRRGKWIREKLLAGTIPDVPITVDAVIPEDHHKTLRQRLEKRTSAAQCWKCHQRMDPLGLPFEIYDDFGRFRTDEKIEHPDNIVKDVKQAAIEEGIQVAQYKTMPIESTSILEGSGDSELDGPVRDGIALSEKLSRSPRVRQSIIRHAFRYFLGRNESLSDAKTLQDAEQAYLDSHGSFDAVIVSLLSSDSFIYRKANQSN